MGEVDTGRLARDTMRLNAIGMPLIAESGAAGPAPLAAAARFLAAPKRERFVYQAALDAVDFIQGRAKGERQARAARPDQEGWRCCRSGPG